MTIFELLVSFRMLDDFGNELENTESKLDSTMKKVAKVLRMNNGEFLLFVIEIDSVVSQCAWLGLFKSNHTFIPTIYK